MIRINFLDTPTYEDLKWFIREIIYLFFLLFTVIVILWMVNDRKQSIIDENNEKISQLEQMKSTYEAKQKEYERKQKELAEIENKTVSLKSLFDGRGETVRIMEILQVNTPKEVWYDRIALKSNVLELSGSSNDAVSVAELVKLLTGTKAFSEKSLYSKIYFNDVDLKKVTQRGTTQQFTIQLKVVTR